MKKSKIAIITLLIIPLLSGCSAEYNLYVTENQLIEEVEVSSIDVNYSPQSLRDSVARDYGIYYDITTIGDPGDCNNCDFKYPFGISASRENNNIFMIRDSKIVKEYFGNLYISTIGSKYTIKANPDDQLKSLLVNINKIKPLLNEIIINVHITYPVIKNNATKVDGDIYTWIYNKDNYKQKIELTYETAGKAVLNNDVNNNKESNLDKEKKAILNPMTLYIIAGIVVVLTIIGILYLLYKKRKNDRI